MASVSPGRGAAAARALAWLVPVALALAAYRSNLSFDLVGDAVPLIEQNPLMRDLRNLGAMAAHDYFWSPAGESIGYWRPVTKVSWLLETVAGGGRPWVYHAVQLAWLAAGTAGVAALGLALGLAPLAAGLAACAFALHPATAEPASLVMARSDLVCAAAAAWAATAWLRWREGGGRGALALHAAALAVAFGSKEAAVALLPALLAWSLPALRPARAQGGGVRHLAPAAAVTLCYFALRARLLGEGSAVPFAADPARLFSGVGAFLRAAVPHGPATGLRNLTPAEAASGGQVAAAAAAWLAVALLAAWAWRRWRPGLPLLAWALGALAVVLLVGPVRVPGAADQIALADRWLFAALAPAAVLVAGLASRIPSRAARGALAAAAAAGVAAMVAVGPRLHEPYGSRLGLLALEEAQYVATPERFRLPGDECRSAERALVRAAAGGDVDGALAVHRRLRAELGCGGPPTPDLTLLALLLGARRVPEALPVAEDLAARGIPAGRFRARGLALVAEALHANGRPAAALALLERGWRETPGDCAVGRTLARAYAAAGRDREAAALLAATAPCAEPVPPGVRDEP